MEIYKFDYNFNTKITRWTYLKKIYGEVFSEAEQEKLFKTLASFDSAKRTIAHIAIENKYAVMGGLAAITQHLPVSIKNAGEKVIFITPLHKNNPNIKASIAKGQLVKINKTARLHIKNKNSIISLYQDRSQKVSSYYVSINNYFSACQNPYCYHNPDMLLEDAMVFCRAIPLILTMLGLRTNIIIHAHDWETALAAITSKMSIIANQIGAVKTVLTLHNSYDYALSEFYMIQFFGRTFPGQTVLQTSIPFLDGPLTTVSTPFAYELRHDPLQKKIFTPHLQKVFSQNPPIGIENGMFINHAECPFSKKAIKEAANGIFKRLLTEKQQFRSKLIHYLQSKKRKNIIGKIEFHKGEHTAPIFMMSGRLDLTQKGFDLVFNAFCKIKKGKAKLLFIPNVSLCKDKSLEFFISIAEKHKGDIAILPQRISRRLYKIFLAGSSYLVMPSLYEPFGSATEAYISGTPLIARGTGGLWIQVESCTHVHVPAFYNNLLDFVNKSDKPTGILFREQYDNEDIENQWQEILFASPQQRMNYSLYKQMVASTQAAIEKACSVFTNSSFYGQLIRNSIEYSAAFTWKLSSEKYIRVYNTASTNFF